MYTDRGDDVARDEGVPSTSSESCSIVWVLLDGVGDVPASTAPTLRVGTPLELARRRFLDAVSRGGSSGLLDPVEPGLACGSDTAHLSLLGYDPRQWYRGRGAFESMGAGLHMDAGDIAFKCNFATLDDDDDEEEEKKKKKKKKKVNGIGAEKGCCDNTCETFDAEALVLRRRCDRSFEEEGPVLCAALDGMYVPGFGEKYQARVRYATEHRCGVVVSGEGLSDQITGTDPLKDGLRLIRCASKADGNCDVEECARAEHTARVVDALSREMRRRLGAHPLNYDRKREGKPPANVVLLRGCGKRLDAPSFAEMHRGLRACMVAPTKIIAGIGKTFGIDVLHAEGATGDYRTQLTAKARCAAAALTVSGEDGAPTYNFCFLHVKGIDDAGHDANLPLKVALIEKADAMLGQLLRLLWEQQRAGKSRFIVCVTGDHTTPVRIGDHSHEPVPFVVARLDNIANAFGEDNLLATSLEPLQLVDEHIATLPTDPPNDERARVRLDATSVHPSDDDSIGIDTVATFTENGAAYGSLGRFPGKEVMPLLRRMQADYERSST